MKLFVSKAHRFPTKFLFLPMLIFVFLGPASSFFPFTLPNYMMVGKVLRSIFHVDRLRCLQECHMNEKCLSYNFEPSQHGKGICELNRCGVEDDRDRKKSLIYTDGIFFHQIRSSQAVTKDGFSCWPKSICSNVTSLGAGHNGRIPNSSFSATSIYDDRYMAKYGRLESQHCGWAPKKSSEIGNEYLQIDLVNQFWVCKVATQGEHCKDNKDEWTEKYKISLSLDNSTWNTYNKIFSGNSDCCTVVNNFLPKPRKARYIRFIPTAYNTKMLNLISCFLLGSLMFFCCVKGDVQGSKEQLREGVSDIKNENANNFKLPSEPQNDLQKDSQLKDMSESDRRKFDEGLFETFVGICKLNNIDYCTHEDIKFYADLVSKGDKSCVLTCSKDEMIENQGLMPRGADTKVCIVAIEKFMMKKVPDDKDDQGEIKNALMSGCSALGNSGCAEKRFFWLPFIPAIIGLVKLAGIAAAGYITNMRKDESTRYLNTGSSATRQFIKVAKQVPRVAKVASRVCFSADSHVNVLNDDGKVVQKLLRDVNLGDMIESVDEETGLQTFSRVYYIAHENDDTRSQMLRIIFNDRLNSTKFLGISDRHLMYVTKKGQSTAHPPLKEPIMAMNVEEDDVIWTMENGSLVPRRVTGVMTYYSAARHPLTENHHVIVDGVHASVHILNEQLYRKLSYPLRWTFWANPEWNRSWLVQKLVRVVENGKEPFFTDGPAELMEYWTGSTIPTLLSSPVSN